MALILFLAVIDLQTVSLHAIGYLGTKLRCRFLVRCRDLYIGVSGIGLRTGIAIHAIEESDKKEFEDQYVRTFDFSQNTTMYLSTYELQGTGEQAEELVKFKAFFLENDYDLPKEMPDYIPALLELCAVIDDEKAKEIYDYCKPKLEYIRERFIEAKLPYAFLFDIILSVANGLEDGAR